MPEKAPAAVAEASGPGSPAAPYDILDIHTHLNDASTLTAQQLDSELDRRLAALDARGVRQAVIAADHRYLRPDGITDTRRVNDRIAAYRDALPERFPAAVGIVEPLYGERGVDEIVRCKEALGLVGLSFHTRFQGVSADNVWVRRYLAKMGEVGLLPFMHCFGESIDEGLWRVERIARDLRPLPILVLDAFSTSDQSYFAVEAAERSSNLIFDTATARSVYPILELIARAGASRVVYGSDLYSWPDSERVRDPLADLLSAPLSKDDMAAVLGGTARQLLGRFSEPRQPAGVRHTRPAQRSATALSEDS
jgi:predicted TIM-barrel fold metal-dependent hydrolase